jgi:ethanolamine ammonia-lyase small subunit
MKEEQAKELTDKIIGILRYHLTNNTDIEQTLTAALSTGIVYLSYNEIYEYLKQVETQTNYDLSDITDITQGDAHERV